MTCESCGDKPKKCNKDFTRTVVEIDNPEQITLMRKVTIPASMGDDTTVPPVVGKYKNVLLYYEANQKSYLYSSDGIPTLLANGLTDYEQAVNLPQINGYTLLGNKSADDLGLQDKLTAGDGIEIDGSNIISISDIEQYAHFFDTVADMKAATNLIAGDYARTLGYYDKNDEGGAFYRISSTAPAGYYETLTSGLYAELIIAAPMNVRQFGAKGDGVTDDTAKIQSALDNASTVIVPLGTYMVDAVTSINLNSYNKLLLDNDSIVKAIGNDQTSYKVINISNVHDVEIAGGTISGERDEHTGTSGEWGHCISITGGAQKAYIHDTNLINGWGDGIYFNGCSDIHTARVHVDNVRRNGYSLISITNYVSEDDYIENTNGTAPQAGVDLEPNSANDFLYNVVFNNLYCKNNTTTNFGMGIGGDNINSDYIVVNNLVCENGGNGIYLQSGVNRKGKIVFNDATIHNCTGRSIFINPSDVKFEYLFNKPTVDGYYTSTNSGHAIGIQGKATNVCGNITLIETTIKNVTEAEGTHSDNAIYVNASASGYKNLNFIDSRYLNDRIIAFNTKIEDCIITDKYGLFKYDSDNNKLLEDTSKLFITSSTYTANRTLTVREGNDRFPVGTELTFINTGNYKMYVVFQNQYIYPLTSVTGTTVTLNDKGDLFKIRRLSSTEWTVINSVGNVTAA